MKSISKKSKMNLSLLIFQKIVQKEDRLHSEIKEVSIINQDYLID